MAGLKKVLENVGFYSISSVLLRASSLIFFPIFSKHLSTADYGIISIAASVVGIISYVSTLQLKNAVVKFVNEKKNNQDEQDKFIKSFMGNAFLLSLFSNALFVILSLMFGPKIFKGMLNDIAFYPYIFFSVLAIFFVEIKEFYSAYLVAQQKGKSSFQLTMLYFGSLISLNFLFVVGLGMDAIGILISPLIVGSIFSVYITYIFVRDFTFRIDIILLKRLLNYCLPLIPFIYFGFLIEHTDRIALNKFLGKEASGIYYIAFTFAGIFSTVKETMYMSISPWFFKNWETESAFIVKVMTFLVGGAALICFVVSAFSFELLHVLSSNPELVEAWRYIPILAFGYYIVFLNSMFLLPIFNMENKTYLAIFANFAGFITITILAGPAIRNYQTIGAVSAKLIAFLTMFFVMAYVSISRTKVRFELFPIALISILLGLFSLVQYLPILNRHLLLLKIVMVIVFGVTLLSSFKFRFRHRYKLTYKQMLMAILNRKL